MKELRISFEDHVLSMQGPDRTENLAIKSEYPWNPFSESLFVQLGTMHMVAPYLPKNIRVNFGIYPQIKELIGKMYVSVANEKKGKKLKTPRFHSLPVAIPVYAFPFPTLGQFYKNSKIAILYSGGKDSMWNLMWAIEEYGVDNVLAIHIRGLNKNNGPNEFKHVLKQQKEFGFKHLAIIELNNGSANTGFKMMRSREMFIAGLAIPIAIEFGASKIVREGYFDCTDPDTYFTGVEANMLYFNDVLKKMGIPIDVYWRNRDEMLTIKDLYDRRPEWMPYVCNCFTVLCYQPSHRRNFQKAMPTFPLYDSQCGVCVKCRITNIARILYDSSMNKVATEDVRTFLQKTDTWIRNQKRANAGKMSNVLDMIAGPFMRDFELACQKCGVTARSVGEVVNA